MNQSNGLTARDKALEFERKLLGLGLLQPGELNDTAYRIGLRSDDFVIPDHRFVFTYACLCGELGKAPTLDECSRLAIENGVPDAPRSLDDIVFFTDLRDGELVSYASDVLRSAQDRTAELCRELAREATMIFLHALSCPRCKRWAAGERKAASRRGVHRGNHSARTRKAVCCG